MPIKWFMREFGNPMKKAEKAKRLNDATRGATQSHPRHSQKQPATQSPRDRVIKSTPLTLDNARAIVGYAEKEFGSGRRIEDAFAPFAVGGASTRIEAVQALYLVIADYFHSACVRNSGSPDAMKHFDNYANLSAELSWRILCDNIHDPAEVPAALRNQETVQSFVGYLKTLNPASAAFWAEVYQRLGLDHPTGPDWKPANESERRSRHLARFDWFILTPFWWSSTISAVIVFIGGLWLIGVVLLIVSFFISVVAASLHQSGGCPRLEDTVVYDAREVSFQESYTLAKAAMRLGFAFGVTTLTLALHRGVAWYFAVPWGLALVWLAGILIVFSFGVLSRVMDKNHHTPHFAILWGCAIECALFAVTAGLTLLPILLIPVSSPQVRPQRAGAESQFIASRSNDAAIKSTHTDIFDQLAPVDSATSQPTAKLAETDGKLLADIRAKADKGNPESQTALGWAYCRGELGVARDYVEAVAWYRKAAEQNYAKAQSNLGVAYHEGDGVAQDDTAAFQWWRKAAEQGYADAQYDLGACYSNGDGVAADSVAAIKWYRKAAEQGYAPAQFCLGSAYDKGQGVAQDYVEAIKWCRKAAEQGDVTAQFCIGFRYADGDGVPQDSVEALKWFRKAADQGDAASQFFLGGMYREGQGVAQDNVEAYKWYNLAALAAAKANNAKGESDAIESRDGLVHLMSSSQIAKAQQLCRLFVPQRALSADHSSSPDLPRRIVRSRAESPAN